MDVKTMVGGVLAAAAGVTAIVVGALQGKPGFIVIGAAFLVVTAFALIVGATASPRATPPPDFSFGGKFLGLPEWAMVVVTVVLVAGFVTGGVMLAA